MFEAFTKKIIDQLKATPNLWAHTAVFITVDEGGGYYDSGYVQPLDFFGDGTRIPLILVSPYSQGGRVVHDYSDHVSILKFIERNWRLPPITDRSRDNLPNRSRWQGTPICQQIAPQSTISSACSSSHKASAIASNIVKVFRRRLTSDGGGRHGAGRPGFENLQRTKPRVGRSEGRYLWGFGQRRWRWRGERNGELIWI